MKKTDLVRFPYRLNAAQDPDHFRAIVLSGEQQTRVLGWINPRDSGSRRICYDSPTGIAFLADRDCPQLVLGEYDTVDEVVATYGGIEDDSFGTLTEERARGAKNARTLEIEAQQIELSDSTLGSLPSGQSQGATR